MCKINSVISEKANAALVRRTEAEVQLLELLTEFQLELFNEFIDANTEYEDYIMQIIMNHPSNGWFAQGL